MSRIAIPLFFGMGWLVLQTAFGGFYPTRFPIPDVVLIVVVVFGFRYSLPLGGGLSFFLGFLQDVLAGGVVGLNALSKTVVFSLTKTMVRRFYFPNLISKMLMVFVGAMVDGLLVLIILLIAEGIHIPFSRILHYLIMQALSTGLLSPLVLIITPKVFILGERGQERFSLWI
ncbi:MAG: rod shape-determining protein MreD [Deltaproteobacteria bacterium]|nr:MAG: rod shape-determining protein MreD [Deltaproteobacteria bacterium]